VNNDSHIVRIKAELKAAGVTRYGLAKLESKYLPSIIHENESIKAVVYGKMDYLSAMLVATNLRVIYINKQPFVTSMDEITYEVISGINFSKAGLFASVTLHTRLGDFNLRNVNVKSAQIFVKYIESRRIESGGFVGKEAPVSILQSDQELPRLQSAVDHDAMEYLRQNDLGVLSTVDRTGIVRGAVVNYRVSPDNCLYMLTRSDTAKARGMFAHNQVALTVHESGSLKTLQLEGTIEVVQDPIIKREIFSQLVQPREYNEGTHLPPVTKLEIGSYVVIKITPTFIRLRDYSKKIKHLH
jgi:general stress protein 26